MKTLAYICSYEMDKQILIEDLSFQSAEIKNFAKLHNLDVFEIFTEDSIARSDFKPILLNLMNNYYGNADKLLVLNEAVISKDKNFREWVEYELKRMNIELIYISSTQEKVVPTSKKAILSIKEKIKSIPSLPEIITKSMEILQNKNSSAEELANIITNDIGLTARVLKLVNSSFYGFPKQISTIKQAIVILGFTTIKGLILSASVIKLLTPNGLQFEYKQFWKQSLISALISKEIAKEIDFEQKDEIFSVAFLHNIGQIILAQYDYENYSKIDILNLFSSEELLKREEKECGLNHSEIGGIVAYSWNLPAIYCDVISFHHNPFNAESNKEACCIVNIANKLTDIIQKEAPLDLSLFDREILEKINFLADNITNLHENINNLIADIDNFVNL